jgi:disulfide oxidoreductase YuzD
VHRQKAIFLLSVLQGLLVLTALAPTVTGGEAKEVKNPRQPKRFAIIFNMGYAGDALPKEPEAFEKLVKSIKEANFNTILCLYTPERAAICKKHDVQIFVDLLVDKHHVYKNVEECKKLLESLRKDDTVYGYHLWSDNIGATGPGRTRDVKNVQEWDGTHPAYVGSYRMSKVSSVQGMDAFGYYDFHWTRGGHWGHLNSAFNLTKARQVPFMRYDAANPGIVGKGNPNRAGYTIATSIPFGLKGYMYHYAGGQVNKGTWELDALGQDLKKVNGKFASVGAELMKVGHPTAVYSTSITKDAKNDPLPAPAIPGGLAAVPADAWFKVTGGEVLLGVCKEGKRDVLLVANHNPYASQELKLELREGTKKAERYDRAKGAWTPLTMTDRQVQAPVEDYALEMLRFERE